MRRNKPGCQISSWAVACPRMAGSPRGTPMLQTEPTPAAIAPLQRSAPTEVLSHGTKNSKLHQQCTGYQGKTNTSKGQGLFHTDGMFQTKNCLNSSSPHTSLGNSYNSHISTAHPSGTHSPSALLASPARAVSSSYPQYAVTSKASNATLGQQLCAQLTSCPVHASVCAGHTQCWAWGPSMGVASLGR